MIEVNRKNMRIWSMLGMRRTIGAILDDLRMIDDKFIFVPADSGRYLAYEEFNRNHPDNVVNMGIAEQNMVAACAGLANEGFKVFAAAYGTFIASRALDQVRVNLGIMGLPVKFISLSGGLTNGNLSATHMALEDVANIRAIPGITIITPADGTELVKTLVTLMDFDGPAYVRLTGTANNTAQVYKEDYDFKIGRAVTIREGEDIAIVSNGTILKTVMQVADDLAEKGISCKIINMHTIKPLDEDALKEIAGMKLVVTVEEHVKWGGLGSAVAEFYAEEKVRPMQQIIAVDKDKYPDSGEYDTLLRRCGLTREQILEQILDKYNSL